ncbi:MAG TPA: hypothetical protein VMO26_15275 [Vicinamibacterales bacterium]|nr:hypothetical protein [Vicinamibacterales bacterium]
MTAFTGDTTGGAVHKLVTVGQTLYVGGTFAGISGQARQSLTESPLR